MITLNLQGATSGADIQSFRVNLSTKCRIIDICQRTTRPNRRAVLPGPHKAQLTGGSGKEGVHRRHEGGGESRVDVFVGRKRPCE